MPTQGCDKNIPWGIIGQFPQKGEMQIVCRSVCQRWSLSAFLLQPMIAERALALAVAVLGAPLTALLFHGQRVVVCATHHKNPVHSPPVWFYLSPSIPSPLQGRKVPLPLVSMACPWHPSPFQFPFSRHILISSTKARPCRWHPLVIKLFTRHCIFGTKWNAPT